MSRSYTLDLRWNALLHDFRRSGLTHAEFCRRRGISLHSFRKRLYQATPLKPIPVDPRPATSAAPDFFPVTILPDPRSAIDPSPQPLELLHPNGRRIAIAPGFDPQTLRRLIAVVEDRPCSD